MPIDDGPLRVIQVGAGGMGRSWLATIATNPGVELVGVVDLEPSTARQAADAAGFGHVPVATSLNDLVVRQAAQAVINVTVPAAHYPVSSAALLMGLPVLVEKPLAESVSQGLSMMAAAEVSGRLLMVSQSRRYWQQLTAYRGQIDLLGRVGALTCEFFKASRFGGFREQMPYPLLVDMAVHHFDLARDLLGSDPLSVFCESYNPAWSWFRGDASVSAIFQFTDGVRFAYSGSWCSPGLETSWNGRWRLSAAGGSALWDGDNAPVAVRTPVAVEAVDEPVEAIPGGGPEQIAGSLAEFVTAVKTGSTPWGEVHSNVLSLAMVEAAISSAEAGRPVSIAEVLDAGYAQACLLESHPEVLGALKKWSSVHEAVRGGRRESP